MRGGRFGAFIAVAAVLNLTGCKTAPPEIQPPADYTSDYARLPSGVTPQQACDNLQQAKFEFADPVVDDRAERDSVHREIWKGDGDPTPDATFLARVIISGGMTNYGPGRPESIVVWQDKAGEWFGAQIFSNGKTPQPDYPWPPVAPEQETIAAVPGIFPEPDATVTRRHGSISAETGERIKSFVEAPCFEEEPVSLPSELPLANGDILTCGYDRIVWLLDVTQNGETRAYSRPCRLIGAVGAVIGEITAAARGLETLPHPTRTSFYTAETEATREKMQAFIAAALPGATYESPDLPEPMIVRRYRPDDACGGTMELVAKDGSVRTLTRDWNTIYSLAGWPSEGSSSIAFDQGERTEQIHFGSTVAALKVDGALFNLLRFCT